METTGILGVIYGVYSQLALRVPSWSPATVVVSKFLRCMEGFEGLVKLSTDAESMSLFQCNVLRSACAPASCYGKGYNWVRKWLKRNLPSSLHIRQDCRALALGLTNTTACQALGQLHPEGIDVGVSFGDFPEFLLKLGSLQAR